MNLGTIVQNNSKGWDSNKCWSKFKFVKVENKLYPTIEIIKIRIVIVWSWKKINCSIIGEQAFCKFKAAQEDIFKGVERPLFWSLNSLH